MAGEASGKKVGSRFLVKYRVRPYLRFGNVGYYLNLGRVESGKLPLWRTIPITRGGNPVRWDRLVCRSGRGSAKVSLAKEPAGAYRLGIRVGDPSRLGWRTIPLEFSFFLRGRRLAYSLARPAIIDVLGPLRVVPSSILVGPIRIGRGYRTAIHLVQARPTRGSTIPIDILNAHCISTSVRPPRVRVTPAGDVAVAFGSAGSPGRISGRIVIAATLAGKAYRLNVSYLGWRPNARPSTEPARNPRGLTHGDSRVIKR